MDMAPLTRILQRARLSLRYAPIGRVFRRIGLTGVVRQLYVRRILKAGNHAAHVMGQTLRFKVDYGREITRIDTIEKERDFLQRIAGAIRPGDNVFDVGANVGTVSLLLAKLQPQARVFAFEPEPQNAERLRENVILNEVKNIEVCEIALSDENGSFSLHVLGETGTGSHSLVDDMGKGGETVAVSVIRGDQMVSQLGRPPNVMKVDVEGAELHVLKGLGSALASPSLRDVFVEVHPKKLRKVEASPEDVRNVMVQSGFELIWSKGRGGEEHQHYRKKAD